jgi:hypothetical protein
MGNASLTPRQLQGVQGASAERNTATPAVNNEDIQK